MVRVKGVDRLNLVNVLALNVWCTETKTYSVNRPQVITGFHGAGVALGG